MTKAFPLVAAPPALAWLLGAGRRSEAARGVAAFAAVVAVVTAVGLSFSAAGVAAAARYQLDRPVQVESAQATVVVALSRISGEGLVVEGSHGSMALTGPSSGPVGWVFLLLELAAFAAFTWLAARAGATGRLGSAGLWRGDVPRGARLCRGLRGVRSRRVTPVPRVDRAACGPRGSLARVGAVRGGSVGVPVSRSSSSRPSTTA